jgi:hypothetical protein
MQESGRQSRIESIAESTESSVGCHASSQNKGEAHSETYIFIVSNLPPDTNFFHIGGSSLLASQLARRIRKQYEVSFAGADVMSARDGIRNSNS